MADIKHDAIARSETYFDEDKFKTELPELVAFRTESKTGEAGGELRTYLTTGIAPRLERADLEAEVFENPIDGACQIIVSTRIEDAALPTALIYDHGDVGYGQAGVVCCGSLRYC